MSSKRNDNSATSAPSTPGHPSQQQQQGFQTKRCFVTHSTPIPQKELTPPPAPLQPAPLPKRKHGSNSRAPSDSNRPETPPSQPPRSRFVPPSRREEERTFAMLWEKPSYRTSSCSPALKLDGQDKRPGQHRGSQPFMWPNCRGGEGLRTKGADAFEGATPLEDWLKREDRYERFWGREEGSDDMERMGMSRQSGR